MKDEKKEETVDEARRRFMSAYHPDKWPDATPEIIQELNEICAEQNDYLDRHKGQEYVKRSR